MAECDRPTTDVNLAPQTMRGAALRISIGRRTDPPLPVRCRRGPHLDAVARLGLAHKCDIAGSSFVPEKRHADKRLEDFLGSQLHRMAMGSMWRALGPFGRMPAETPRLEIIVDIQARSPDHLISLCSPLQ
jgi:hypothetical protein